MYRNFIKKLACISFFLLRGTKIPLFKGFFSRAYYFSLFLYLKFFLDLYIYTFRVGFLLRETNGAEIIDLSVAKLGKAVLVVGVGSVYLTFILRIGAVVYFLSTSFF